LNSEVLASSGIEIADFTLKITEAISSFQADVKRHHLFFNYSPKAIDFHHFHQESDEPNKKS
jgi:hypothetical protein